MVQLSVRPVGSHGIYTLNCGAVQHKPICYKHERPVQKLRHDCEMSGSTLKYEIFIAKHESLQLLPSTASQLVARR